MSYASWSVVFGEQPSAAKWNILGTNDASFNDGTGFGDSSVLPKHLFTGTGSSWAMQSYTPTLTNVTLGNGTKTGLYTQHGKLVFCRGEYIAGSTSSVSGSISMSLPVTATATAGYQRTVAILGMVNVYNSGVNQYICAAYLTSTTTVALQTVNASGTNATTSVAVDSTTPFTWSGANGGFIWNFVYEAA